MSDMFYEEDLAIHKAAVKAMEQLRLQKITLRFTTPSGEYPGAFYSDYFKDSGLRRAEQHPNPDTAGRILARTYRGPDADGIGVEWEIEGQSK